MKRFIFSRNLYTKKKFYNKVLKKPYHSDYYRFKTIILFSPTENFKESENKSLNSKT